MLFFFQVNAGPLAYAQTFLDSSVIKDYVTKHVEALQATYRFVVVIQTCAAVLLIFAVI